jgi:hypothetical protein
MKSHIALAVAAIAMKEVLLANVQKRLKLLE